MGHGNRRSRGDAGCSGPSRPGTGWSQSLLCSEGGQGRWRALRQAAYGDQGSPGFITEALPIVLLSLARRLDLLTIDEFADCTDGCSEEMLLGVMGFGESPEAFAGRPFYERDEVFGRSLRALADAVGIEIERFETSSEVAVARGCLAGLPRAASVTTAPRRVGARADARQRNRPGRLPESPAGRHGRHPPRDGHWCA